MKRQINLADELAGKRVRLPNDELVEIETIYNDGYARVIRVDGDRAGTAAVCRTSRLEVTQEPLALAIRWEAGFGDFT